MKPKWQNTLTKRQVHHLNDMKHPTLRSFIGLRMFQRRIAEETGTDLGRVCYECDEIERRLKAAKVRGFK